jgi:hypothetical protein
MQYKQCSTIAAATVPDIAELHHFNVAVRMFGGWHGAAVTIHIRGAAVMRGAAVTIHIRGAAVTIHIRGAAVTIYTFVVQLLLYTFVVQLLLYTIRGAAITIHYSPMH